jgi:hypothetical protein
MRDAGCGIALLLALAWAWPLSASAQAPAGATPQESALLARVDSLYRQIQARAEQERRLEQVRNRAVVVEDSGWAIVVPGQIPADRARHSLDTARTILQEFGGIPEGFARSLVIVAPGATDTGRVLSAPIVRHRRRVGMGGIQYSGSLERGDGRLDLSSFVVAGAFERAFKDSRDSDWREWLPWDFGFRPWTRAAAWDAFQSLTRSPLAVGGGCLAGDPAACRRWLGVDRDSAPFRARFDATELRADMIRRRLPIGRVSRNGAACLSGNGEACYAFFASPTEGGRFLSPIPADETGRRSLLRELRALHGPSALQQALADTAGSVGERLSRAAGIGVDSLMLEWRYWVLTRGGRPQDRNLLADAAPAVLLAGLLLAAARRSRG